MPSIRLRLLKWLIGPILLINLAGGVLTYVLAWLPVQSAFEQSLQDAAGAPSARLSQKSGDAVDIDLPKQTEQVLRADAVAKTLRKRLQIRNAIFRALILLETVFTLATVGLIWFSVTNGLLPLNRMRADLNARSGADLAPVGTDNVPYELEPTVSAFNDLLDKVRAGARAQHDFLANVAHQLRTPLAGLKTQLEWLGQRHPEEPETVHSIKLMLVSTERMIRQTNQLLALARAEPSHFESRRLGPVALDQLVEQAIQYFVDEAAKKSIDLGFDLRSTTVLGERFLLRDLIDNLIDNAIRYTPPHGTVTVGCFPDGQAGMLVIEDSGPGIPLAKRELVFNRFVRLDDKSTGSGLGLAIVRDIALAHGAKIALESNSSGAGMVVSVRFPV